jgi:large subunit ribosomal protein L21
MDYAIIKLGGKQYRVRDGETLVVDRVGVDEGKTLTPDVLLGDGGVTVTATVVAHERGPKIRIGKYRRRTGYKRHNGFRAATSRIAISLGSDNGRAASAPAPTETTAEATEAKAGPAAIATGLPPGYEEMTVAQIADGAKTWDRSEVEAALAYEEEHAARKGATAALETALGAVEEEG